MLLYLVMLWYHYEYVYVYVYIYLYLYRYIDIYYALIDNFNGRLALDFENHVVT